MPNDWDIVSLEDAPRPQQASNNDWEIVKLEDAPAPAATPAPPSGAVIGARPLNPLERLQQVLFGGQAGETALGRAFPSLSTARLSAPPGTELPAIRTENAFIGGNPTTVPEQIAGGVLRGTARVADGLTTGTNLALAGLTGGAPTALTRLAGVGFGVTMLYDAYQQVPAFRAAVERGDIGGATAILTAAIAQGGLGALGVKHGAEGVTGAIDSAIEGHNARAERLVEQDRAQGRGGEQGQAILEKSDIPVSMNGQDHQIVASGANKQGRPIYQVLGPDGKPVFAGYGNAVQDYLRMRGARPPGAAPEVAPEEPRYPEAAPRGRPEPLQNAPSARKIAPPPEVPEIGTPERVSRVMDARERLAQEYGGKSWDDLSNPERLTIDHWVNEGYGFSAARPEPEAAPEPQAQAPAARAPQQPAATPQKPVAPAPEAQAKPSDWDIVNIEPATPAEPPAAAPQQQEDAKVPELKLGDEASAKVTAGYKVPTRYAIADADQLVASHDTALNENPKFPQELQPRDRTRASSHAQVAEIYNRLEPEQLGSSFHASDGAPIVGPDRVVESGNGRTIALQRLYGDNHPNAQAYRAWLEQNAQKFGLDPGDVQSTPKPVLVRVRTGLPEGVTRKQFTSDANEAAVAGLSAPERAQADASKLDSSLLNLFQPEEGDVTSAANRDFVRAFADKVVGRADRDQFITAEGEISQAGIQRMRNAIFARAYGDAGILAKLTEDPDSNIRNLTSGMIEAAPRFAKLHQGIEEGVRHDRDISGDVAAAARKVSGLRATGQTTKDYLAQQTLFGAELTPIQTDLLKMFDQYARSPRLIGQVLHAYLDGVDYLGDPHQESMFAEVGTPSKADILQTALNLVEERRAAEKEKKTANGSLPTPIREGRPGSVTNAPRRPASTPAARQARVESNSPGRVRAEARPDVADSTRQSQPLESRQPGQAAKPAPRPTPSSTPVAHALRTVGGLDQFAKDDVASTLKDAAAAVVEAGDDILKILAPTMRSRNAQRAGLVLRHRMGELARRFDQAEAALEKAHKFFESQSPEDNFEFIDRMEEGRRQKTAELQAIADVLRKMLDERRREVQGLGSGKLQKFYTNYFPHVWKRSRQASQIFSSFFGRRPMEGGKGFLKQRTHITFRDGLEAGLEPVSANPIDLVLLKAREMDKYLMAHRVLKEWKQDKLVTFIDARTGKAPRGWMKIDDPIGTVYGPSKIAVEEHPNEGLYEGLQELARDLGLRHRRAMKVGRGSLGLAWQNTNRLATKFATDEQVLAHEIGHHIQFQYNFIDGMLKHPDKKTRKALKQELRDLADARFEGLDADDGYRSYVRNRDEKAANVVAAYVTAREKMRRIAPTVLREFEGFIGRHPELQQIRHIEPNLVHTTLTDQVDAGGLVIKGHWWAPEQVARVLNNYLAPGLRMKSGLYRFALGANNVLQQFQLGYSGFHFGFTSFDAAISKVALGFEQALRGKPLKGLATALQAPAAPFTNYLRGSKVLQEWYRPGSQGDFIAAIADGMEAAGGRARMDSFYQTNLRQQMMRAFRAGNVWGGLMRAPFALTEAASSFLMENVVPRQKMGVFADLAAHELERLGPDASIDQVRERLSKVWDSVDNRMGQLVYDNLFWDRTAKDVAMLGIRSVGWNLGTLREIGGAGVDAVKIPLDLARGGKDFDEVNLHRLAYVMGLVTVNAVASAVYQYLHTGEGPKSWKDLVFPRNGHTAENGRPERVSWPTYAKDVFHYAHEPLNTIAGKVAPMWTQIAEQIRNKDFYGDKIRNEDDPLIQQMLDSLKHVGSAFEPFGFRNLARERRIGSSLEQQLQQLVGVTRAPAALEKTKAERLAEQLASKEQPEAGRTREEAQTRQAEREIAQRIRNGQSIDDAVAKAYADGVATPRGIRETVRNAQMPPLERTFKRLNMRDALRVYGAATPEEKERLRPMLFAKMKRAENLPTAQREALASKFRAAIETKP